MSDAVVAVMPVMPKTGDRIGYVGADGKRRNALVQGANFGYNPGTQVSDVHVNLVFVNDSGVVQIAPATAPAGDKRPVGWLAEVQGTAESAPAPLSDDDKAIAAFVAKLREQLAAGNEQAREFLQQFLEASDEADEQELETENSGQGTAGSPVAAPTPEPEKPAATEETPAPAAETEAK